MIRFATHDLAPQDRFDHWREVRGKHLFGVTIEMPAARRAGFRGTFSARPVGNAIASELRASAYQVSRTPADIARVAADSLCIGWQIHGAGMFDTGSGHHQFVGNGDMIVNHSDQPYRATPATTDDFHFRLLKIPVDDTLMLGQPVDDLFAARYVASEAFSRPFRALFRALTAEDAHPDDPAADLAHVTRLALVARGRLRPGMTEVRAALRAGQRYAAREIMARRRHQPDLTPTMVATELGISVRQLFIVFESVGQSYLQTLTLLRLDAALRLLAAQDTVSVTKIFQMCGFDSLATFYRVFKRYHGMAPGEYREQQLAMQRTSM